MFEFEIILYVANQQKSKEFYSKILNRQPILDVQGMTEFAITENVKLGLMPETGISKLLYQKIPKPELGNGIPRCELYIKTDDAKNLFNIALASGAKLISDFEARDWKDIVAYVSDFDGNIIAFAFNI